MSAPHKRSRLVSVIIVLALVGGAAIAAYSSATSPESHSDGASLVGSTDGSGSASESSSTDPDIDAENETDNATGNDIPSGAFAATVTYVHDGDTLYLDNGSAEELKVRLIGLDTPELASQQRPDAEECYGVEARELLRDFLPEGTDVWALEDREPEDRYGRSLLYVYLQDGTLVNLAMVELGAAEALKVGLNDRFWPELRNAEDDAYAAKLGMWGSC